MDKFLKVLAWVMCALSIVAFLVDDFPWEATYCMAAAIFFVIAPRKI